jgi:hypothetical protein
LPGEPSQVDQFLQEAEGARVGLLAEFWDFLKHNKKWWLLPILVMILGMSILVVLGGSSVAPFIYTLF